MKTHKRRKNSRIRGARTCGWGFRQKHKGPGNRGGVGMCGSGAHKRQMVNGSAGGDYFGKQGVTSRSTKKKKYDKINLKDIKLNFFKKAGDKLDFSGYKILGEGDGFKAEITAKSASKSAIEKMNKAGGKLILSEASDEKEEVEESEDEE
jgi:large subunit ribosomal protein L15